MIFKQLRIANWRQYREIDLEFHPRLTILTGANGAGKTTVLNLLSRHFGWDGTLVSTPRAGDEGTEFTAGFWTQEDLDAYEEWLREKTSKQKKPSNSAAVGPEQPIGSLTYGNEGIAPLSVPANVGSLFNVNIQNQQEKKGLHIPSHRPIFSYQTVESIPTIPRRRDQAFAVYTEIVKTRHYGRHHQRTPNYYMKETLIALAAFGHGNAVIERDAESLEAFEGFQKVLQVILPPSLGFLRLAVRLPEVVLVTRSGDFSLDAASGGISSLVDLAWQIYMYASADTPFAVTIDEPENHLHPEMQRTLLANFLTAFPNVQFICATHNPFIVTSVPDSHTYALRYGPDNRVRSEFLKDADRTGTSNEILRDVLGLPSSSPLWVENDLRQIERSLLTKELTAGVVDSLREQLSEKGLERYLPSALARLAQERLSK